MGILFLVIGGMNINDEPDQKVADILNDAITVLVFLITLVNVIINGFGIRYTDTNVGIKWTETVISSLFNGKRARLD